MCIALISTAHPSYPLILIDNRDEYLNRPTDRARWWPEPDSHVLGGRDMLRDVHGTWLGVTRGGKVAVLTNYREDTTPPRSAVSRGAIIKKFLAEDVGPVGAFVRDVVDTGVARDAGGFSLVCGEVGGPLAVVSNRAGDQGQVPWIAGDVAQTVGLSNAAFGDRTWEKVRLGEELLLDTIRYAVERGESEDGLVCRLLGVLGHDTLPRRGRADDAGLEAYLMDLRHSIYIPPLGRRDGSMPDRLPDDEVAAARLRERVDVVGFNTPTRDDSPSAQTPAAAAAAARQLGVSGLYGTQKQTVVLVDKDFNVRFFERTLFDQDSNPIPPGEGDVDVRFKIEKSTKAAAPAAT